MGICLSSSVLCGVGSESDFRAPPTAKVVSVNGVLREYSLPVLVSQVLQAEITSSSSSSSSSNYNNYFLCNSDLLSYDDYIPVLDSDCLLQQNQIYFVLPKSKLQRKLAASDMAALAVKASVALQNAAKNNGYRRKKNKARISPVLLVTQAMGSSPSSSIKSSDSGVVKRFETPNKLPQAAVAPSSQLPKSGSARKLRKYSSRRAKLAARSFKLRLSTIYEGADL